LVCRKAKPAAVFSLSYPWKWMFIKLKTMLKL